ncbi:MAG: cyclophilin family peptidyl-prolyl cis-trans isomerase [Verrucomicrobiales bacterium]|jgi:cyclophilin family peptidyl-prolyl cis-trans isomerase
MKLRSSFFCAALLLASGPAFAQEESQPTGKPTAALDLVVNGQIRRVVIELEDQVAPQTVANFEKLAKSGFYNGLAVHRAIPNYVIQLGDPYTRDESQKHLWGTGGPDHSVPSEIKLKHTRGAVAMAKLPDGSASSGSQFFIVLADQTQLDGKYTVFANVIRGLEHLDYVAGTTVDTNDVPVARVEVNAVTYAAAGAEPEANADGALLSGAATAAGDVVRGAGQKVAEAVPDKMPKPRLPKFSVPFLGRKKEAVPPPPAPEPAPAPVAEPAPAPSTPLAPVAANDDRVPPEFDLLTDEIAGVEDGTPPPAAPAPAPAAADDQPPAPEVTEDPNTGRKLLSLPVMKSRDAKGEKGLVTRVIERVW